MVSQTDESLLQKEQVSAEKSETDALDAPVGYWRAKTNDSTELDFNISRVFRQKNTNQ